MENISIEGANYYKLCHLFDDVADGKGSLQALVDFAIESKIDALDFQDANDLGDSKVDGSIETQWKQLVEIYNEQIRLGIR